MNPQVKEKWLNALRSGEYEQATGKLKTPQGFCCLGVLTDLYVKEKNQDWILRSSDPEDIVDEDYYTFEQTDDFLPHSVMKWAGLDSNCPEVMIENEDYNEEYDDGECEYIPQKLSDLNDDGMTFDKIADLIESQL